MTDIIAVGEKRQIYNSKLNKRYCVEITQDNIESILRYDRQDKTDDDWVFGDVCAKDMQNLGENGTDSYNYATISFTEDNELLKIDVVPSIDAEVLAWQQQAGGGRRRSRKVKKSKISKKRPTRRSRSSKARKARKSSKVSKSRTTRRK